MCDFFKATKVWKCTFLRRSFSLKWFGHMSDQDPNSSSLYMYLFTTFCYSSKVYSTKMQHQMWHASAHAERMSARFKTPCSKHSCTGTFEKHAFVLLTKTCQTFFSFSLKGIQPLLNDLLQTVKHPAREDALQALG